jgi:hypothetical protein
MVDPVTTAVISWATSQAGTAGLHGFRRLLGDKQQKVFRALVHQAIGSAINEVIAVDDRDVVRETLMREPVESAHLQVKDVLDLREAILGSVGPQLAALAEQGYDFDSGRLVGVLAGNIKSGIQADAVQRGPLAPLAEWLRHEETVDQLRGVNRALGEALGRSAREEAATLGPVGRPISQLGGPFALGVHKAVDVGAAELPVLPFYVRRAHDERLGQIIQAVGRTSAMVVLVGDSSTGKTRALWEAIQHLPERWRLWSPPDVGALHTGLVNGSIGPRTVLWLDDAHNHLNPRLGGDAVGNARMLRELLSSPEVVPVLVAATLWPGHWLALLRGQSGAAGAQVSALLAAATRIVIPDKFLGEHLADVRQAARKDPRLAAALAGAPGGRITQYLAGAHRVLECYETALPDVRAVIDAAIDAVRLGHRNRLPEHLLLDAAPGYGQAIFIAA